MLLAIAVQSSLVLAPIASAEWELAFERKGDIWMANADGSHLRRLIANGQRPTWSRDGKRLAFIRKDGIYLFDLATKRSQKIGEFPKGTAEDEWSAPKITWDPKRPYLVAGALSTDALDLYSLRTKSKLGQCLVGKYRIPTFAPTWSADGSMLAFVRYGDIWIARPGDENLLPATYFQRANRVASLALFNDADFGASGTTPYWVDDLDWTPTGDKLLFHFQRMHGSGVSEVGYLSLRAASAPELQGEEMSGLHADVHWLPLGGRGLCWTPRVCPDGKTVSFVSSLDGSEDLTLSDWSGKLTRVIMRSVTNPDWRPLHR